MSAATPHGQTPYYFIPAPSRHPAMAALGLFFVILGAGQWVNGTDWGKWSLLLGLFTWLATLFVWFRDAIGESEGGLYSERVDVSYRWSMSWFIFSEVMFFAAFFGARFRFAFARSLPAPLRSISLSSAYSSRPLLSSSSESNTASVSSLLTSKPSARTAR